MSKQILIYAVLTLLAISCGKEDKSRKPYINYGAAVSVEFRYTLSVTQQMLDYCDLTVEYSDNGDIKSEMLADVNWSKDVHCALPFEASLKLSGNVAAGKNIEMVSQFLYAKAYNCSYVLLDAQGRHVGMNSAGDRQAATVGGSEFRSMLDKNGGVLVSYSIEL